MDLSAAACTSAVRRPVDIGKRSVKNVPFVELINGRVQGVVSSGSDIERVYVSFFDGASRGFYCSTNNNRPCGGLRGAPCKHILELIDEAMMQFGPKAVADYLGFDDYQPGGAMPWLSQGTQQKEPSGIVFSRFLSYLRYLELPTPSGHILEMSWFVS